MAAVRGILKIKATVDVRVAYDSETWENLAEAKKTTASIISLLKKIEDLKKLSNE